MTGLHSPFNNVSDCRDVADCISRGGQLDPGPVPFMEIDHELIFSMAILPSANSRRVVVSHKRKYVHKVLVNQ